MSVTERELNRATLARQLLLERAPMSVADAVGRVVVLQAQVPASAYVALWNRLAGFDPADLDRAYAGHQVVRARLMRVTMHAVHVGAKAAVLALGGSLVLLEGPGGTVLYDVPSGLRPDGDIPAPPRLMAMWDSVDIGACRDRVLD